MVKRPLKTRKSRVFTQPGPVADVQLRATWLERSSFLAMLAGTLLASHTPAITRPQAVDQAKTAIRKKDITCVQT